MNINIRAYQESDQAALLNILRLLTPQYFDPSEEKEFVEYLANEIESYFVLELEKEIVGSGGINFGFDEGKTARISWDLIHPDAQGRGLGTKLIQFRIAEIRKNIEIDRILVRTSQVAFQFYEKNGFQLLKIERDYWAKGFDLYEMELQSG